ncbi:MAG: acylphosphatase [Gammaproteobacteria bacterium]
MNRQVRLVVSGRVQGVFYRASTRNKAVSLNIKGYAKNLPDGRVEVVADGRREAVDQLIAWCRQGPAKSEVSGVLVEDIQPPAEYFDFDTY